MTTFWKSPQLPRRSMGDSTERACAREHPPSFQRRVWTSSIASGRYADKGTHTVHFGGATEGPTGHWEGSFKGDKKNESQPWPPNWRALTGTRKQRQPAFHFNRNTVEGLFSVLGKHTGCHPSHPPGKGLWEPAGGVAPRGQQGPLYRGHQPAPAHSPNALTGALAPSRGSSAPVHPLPVHSAALPPGAFELEGPCVPR